MARTVRSARGEEVDFDAIRIKQQLAEAPTNIEVARRQAFIDTREGKRTATLVAPAPIEAPKPAAAVPPATPAEDFMDDVPATNGPAVEPIPTLPVRTPKSK